MNTMPCRGICHRYKVSKPHFEKGGRYENGQKRCNECDIFMKWDGRRCPCCGKIFRLKPRSGITRQKFLAVHQNKRI